MHLQHDVVPGSNGSIKNTVRCPGCGKMGNYLLHCLEIEEEDHSIKKGMKADDRNIQGPNHM